VQFGTQANTNLGKMGDILKQSNLVGLDNVHILCKGQQMHFGKKSDNNSKATRMGHFNDCRIKSM
jgi:hypothetical protein